MVRVGIVGAGKAGTSVLRMLLKSPGVTVAAICDINPDAPGIAMAREAGIPTFRDVLPVLQSPGVDVLVEVTGDPEVQRFLKTHIPEGVSLLDAVATRLMVSIIEASEQLHAVKEMKEELAAILNCAEEGIQVVDASGVTRFMNPAAMRILGIHEKDRLGRSVLDSSPDGGLARVLRTGQPAFGVRNRPVGTQVEVVTNASPIFIDSKMIGAVAVFQDVTDILRLSEQLRNSTSMLENLFDSLGDLTRAKYTFGDLAGSAPSFLEALELARIAADSDSTVLLQGESGTGKELFAHAIHNSSRRRDKPFITVNCAAIPEALLESEFFGYERGAFTGAVKRKLGRFDLADGGTILLDEVGDMSPTLQAKLLRVLQEKEFQRVGGTQSVRVDVRVIASTNRDLRAMIASGDFRADLYYRLNVVGIDIPPLRERMEDLPLLASRIILRLNRRLGKNVEGLSDEAMALMMRCDWPGNIRELENVLERAMNVVRGNRIEACHLDKHLIRLRETEIVPVQPLEELEKAALLSALEKHGWSLKGKTEAARALGVSLSTLYNMLRRHNLSETTSRSKS